MPYEIRMPEYLSPTSIKIADANMEEFAIKYLLKVRAPRPPQTKPMAVGSAFDAFVKSRIYKNIFGNYGPEDKYDLVKLFETQVEVQNRDYARIAGLHCLDEYIRRGALADLMLELKQSIGPPRFEFSISDTIRWNGFDVPLLGKPDIFYINEMAARSVTDWKVNGYCSTYNTSPMKGYVCCRSSDGTRSQHRDAMVTSFKGIMINAMLHLEDCNKDWADQLSIYGWLLGEPIGSADIVYGIDQITGPGCNRISSHRLRIKPEYQYHLMDRIAQIWSVIQSGHIFREMSREESDAKLQLLEDVIVAGPTEIDAILS